LKQDKVQDYLSHMSTNEFHDKKQEQVFQFQHCFARTLM